MVYRCRGCGHEEARGCIPTVSCGLYLAVLGGIGVGIGVGLLGTHGLLGMGTASWWWLLAVPVLPVVCMFAAIPLHYCLAAVEWLVYCLRRCPKCGARRWSWGFTQGFGL